MKMFTAVQLAKEMKLSPKRVRSILRKVGYEHDGRWKFPVGDKPAMKEAIRNARKRATRKAPVIAKKQTSKRSAVDNHASLH